VRSLSPVRFLCLLAGSGTLAALLALQAAAQQPLPPGTILAVSLNGSLNAAKVHAGQPISATLMQSMPGSPIRRLARVVGRVVQVSNTANGQTRLEIIFDSVESHGRRFPIRADLRALASRNAVEAAQVPTIMSSRGMTPDTWPTTQIGGDQDYRGGGPVARGGKAVGTPAPYGILAVPQSQPGQPCRGVVNGNRHPQALWLFSTDACGIYGYPHLRIQHAGRTNPRGAIVLAASKGKLNLYSGTGMLLRVQSLAAAGS
jgi:hypothetical protein